MVCFFLLLLSSLEVIDTKVYEPEIRALPGTAAYFRQVVVLKSSDGIMAAKIWR